MRDVNFCGSQITPGLYELCDVPDLHGLIAPRPLLVEIGAYDECFKIESAMSCFREVEKIYAAAGVRDRLELDLFEGGHRWGGNKSVEFFRKHGWAAAVSDAVSRSELHGRSVRRDVRWPSMASCAQSRACAVAIGDAAMAQAAPSETGRRRSRRVKFRIRDGHPRVLVRPDDLPALRRRAATTHAAQMQSLLRAGATPEPSRAAGGTTPTRSGGSHSSICSPATPRTRSRDRRRCASCSSCRSAANTASAHAAQGAGRQLRLAARGARTMSCGSRSAAGAGILPGAVRQRRSRARHATSSATRSTRCRSS